MSEPQTREKETLKGNATKRASHVLGEFELSFTGARIVSPEHATHVDSRLTQEHEKTHRNLTFTSTFGFFSFIIAQIARFHPDPIRRYQFGEMRDLLIEHSQDPQEGCAYFNESITAELVSPDAPGRVRASASERERWAMTWIERAVKPLRLGKSLQSGFGYLLADLSMCSPIVCDFIDSPPEIERLRLYLGEDINSPNSRFLAFVRAAFWRRWSLRSCFQESLRAFCAEQNVLRDALDGIAVDIDRQKIARLEYLMDRSFQGWLEKRFSDHRIIPVDKRMSAIQAMLDRWHPQLPPEVQRHVPDRAEFLQVPAFFDRNDAILANPTGLERTYRSVEGLSSIRKQLEDSEICVCVISPNAYPLVQLHQFADKRIPDGCLQVTVSVFDTALTNFFVDVGYSWWGRRGSILEELRTWSAPRTVLIVQWEDVAERGGRILGVPRSEIPCSIRVLHSGLVLSEVPPYLASLGSEQFSVRAHIMLSGNKQQVPILIAKTDEFPRLEFIAPVTPMTANLMQKEKYAPWVKPKLKLEEYESHPGQVRATVNACERIARFGFG